MHLGGMNKFLIKTVTFPVSPGNSQFKLWETEGVNFYSRLYEVQKNGVKNIIYKYTLKRQILFYFKKRKEILTVSKAHGSHGF